MSYSSIIEKQQSRDTQKSLYPALGQEHTSSAHHHPQLDNARSTMPQAIANNSPIVSQLRAYQQVANSVARVSADGGGFQAAGFQQGISGSLQPPMRANPTAVLQKRNIPNFSASPVIQRMEIPERDYNEVDLMKLLHDNKVALGLSKFTNLAISRFTTSWVAQAIDSERHFSPNPKTTAQTIASSMIAEESKGDGGWHVPKNADVEHKVKGVTYKFHNDGNGYLDFDAPLAGGAACPNAGGNWDLTIHDPAHGDRLINTHHALASGSRSQHFREANIIREGVDPPANGSSSPAGYTWHHHVDKGRMQLIDRDVHAAFSHKGGFSVWGS